MNNLAERQVALVYLLGGATGLLCFIPILPAGLTFSLAAIFLSATFLRTLLGLPGRHPVQNTALGILVILFVPLSLLFSPLPDVSLRGAAVFVWCVGAMLAVEVYLTSGEAERGPGVIITAAMLFALVALAFLEPMQKFPIASALNAALPHFGGFAGVPVSGLPANELGGVAAWLVPVLLVLVLYKRTAQRRTISAFAALLLVLIVLIAAQSRGAYLAAFAGLFVALVLAGTRGRILLGVLLGAVVAGIAVIGVDTLTGVFSYHRRFDSFFPILSGRSELWERGWMLLTDLPTIGTGFAAFGHIISGIYPPQFAAAGATVPIEDVHNLYLQTALDLGVTGAWLLILFLFSMIVMLFRDYRQSRSALSAGLLGGVVSYMLFNFTDAVSLGSPATAVVFVLFGITRMQRDPVRSREYSRVPMLAVTVSALIVLAVSAIIRPLGEQRQISLVIHNLQLEEPEFENALNPQNPSPHLLWYEGLQARAEGNQPLLMDRWGDLAAMAHGYIPFMAYAEPHNNRLATAVAGANPASPEAAFWLARNLEQDQPEEAIAAYRRGLKGSPNDGWAWLGLGNTLQVTGDTAAAHRAYVKACFHDDPALNGCLRAARTAEAMGDTALALKYYDISNFIGAKKRAAELRHAMDRQQ